MITIQFSKQLCSLSCVQWPHECVHRKDAQNRDLQSLEARSKFLSATCKQCKCCFNLDHRIIVLSCLSYPIYPLQGLKSRPTLPPNITLPPQGTSHQRASPGLAGSKQGIWKVLLLITWYKSFIHQFLAVCQRRLWNRALTMMGRKHKLSSSQQWLDLVKMRQDG